MLLPRLAVVLTLVAWLAISVPALGVEIPGQSCPDQTRPPGATEAVCADKGDPGVRGGPSGGLDLGVLLPIAGVVVLAGGLALVGAMVVIRRRTGGPVAPADPGEWWTCRKCGSHNVIGSPRCYSCGTWQQ